MVCACACASTVCYKTRTRSPKTSTKRWCRASKWLAGLRTDEHQAAQDGRFRHQVDAHAFLDPRVPIVPTYHGENAVLRLLEDKTLVCTLADLGFSEGDCNKIIAAIQKQSGMILADLPHRERQDHDALYAAENTQLQGCFYRDHRGPDRVRGRRHRAVAGQYTYLAQRSPTGCAPYCAKTPTPSWSVRSATARPRALR